MEVTKEDLLELLRFGNKGIIILDEVPHEISLSNNGQFQLTGTSWKWEETAVSSSHHDYEISADTLQKKQSNPRPLLVNQSIFSFYPSIDDFIENGY